jgi:large subunit ribosomal protein L25
MEQYTLKAQRRTVTGKQVRRLRREGQVPAIIYGHRIDPLAVQIDELALDHLLQQVGGNQLIKLQVGDDDATRTVLLRDVQREPIKRRPLHVDLYEVVMTERIRAEIPVVFRGTSPVVESGEGLLQHGVETVEVECLPGNLIQSIEIDVSQLTAIDQEITVGDLQFADDLEILSDPETSLARVLPVQEEVIEEVEEVVPEAAPEAEAEVEAVPTEEAEEAGGETGE